jgi:ATP-dependent DNA helicase PIF1
MIRPTLLFSRNADVDAINERNVTALNKPMHGFDAKTDIVRHEEYPGLDLPGEEQVKRCVQRLDTDANYVPHLELCVGCQVMLITNLDMEAGLVNGSRGVVIEFREGFPVVQFLHGEPLTIGPHKWVSEEHPYVVRAQIPLRVAYAITIHKSQGATLDCALVDIGTSTFEYGQAYVALSRVRDLESLYIWNLRPERIRAHPTVKTYYESLAVPAV